MDKKATFEKLYGNRLRLVTAVFAAKSNKELRREIGELERTVAFALKRNPDLDPSDPEIMELKYYIDLRKKALK